MANRGQKRTETADDLPADKRACSSFEFNPMTSNSSAETPIISVTVHHDAYMDTSSSTSGSTRSEVDGEKDSNYGSYDSDNSFHHYYHHRSAGDQFKFKKVLSSLTEEMDESRQLVLLTELCELLSFCSDGSLSSLMADSFSPILVKLARHESNPEIMLLSIRAMTYLCDINPRSSVFLVRHDGVPALCLRLMAFEYLDVAEQCLQALEKISQEQPLACLHAGTIMTALTYIDFFSTSVQRIALSTVVNICKKLTSESSSLFMEAVPILCNLLRYEDRQLVESAVTCLIKIVEQVYQSSDMLDEICKHGLIQHSLHLLGLNSHAILSESTSTGLIGLLVKLAAGSTVGFKKLFELNISNILKDMLSTYELSHKTQSVRMLDGNHSQMHEVLKLLNELLPSANGEQEGQLNSEKDAFLSLHSEVLSKFGTDLLPILIQVVNSGANVFVSYCCLAIIYKLVHFNKSEVLQNTLQTSTFSRFLAGFFTGKDQHLIFLALEIVDTLMIKLPHVFLDSFIKEGVVFSVFALMSPDKWKLSPVFDDMHLETDATQNSASRGVCSPCSAFDSSQSPKSTENGVCKIQKDNVQNLARHLWTTFFETETVNTEKGVTDILLRLRTLSCSLMSLLEKSPTDVNSCQLEEELHDLLLQIVSELNEKDSISTFEFVESGVVKALVSYLSSGRHHLGKEANDSSSPSYAGEKMLGRILLSCDDPPSEKFSLLTMVQRLQNALSSVEKFPVVSSHTFKLRYSFATVPYGQQTLYPCLRVQFVRGNDESILHNYNEDVVNVDPFLPLTEIEGYLWPRVRNIEVNNVPPGVKVSKEKDGSCSNSQSDSSNARSENADNMLSEEMICDNNKLQDAKPVDTDNPEKDILGSVEVVGVLKDTIGQELNSHFDMDGAMNENNSEFSNSEVTSPNLLFYLEQQQLDCELTLYQSILEQIIHGANDNILNSGFWSRVYKITYKQNVKTNSNLVKDCHDEGHCSISLSERCSCQRTPFNSQVFFPEVDSERMDPTYDILSLLRSLERIIRLRFVLFSDERTCALAKGGRSNGDIINAAAFAVSQNEFVNSKLTEKLEQQMRDPTAVNVGGMPAWCSQIMAGYPFIFSFEARCKYFRLAALGRSPMLSRSSSHDDSGGPSGRQQNRGNLSRKKFLVRRNLILESATQMMEIHAHQKSPLEVEYDEEVGTGVGPTLEFYTLVCQEFQRSDLGMWRNDSCNFSKVLEAENPDFLESPFGLFPRPWSPSLSTSDSTELSQVVQKFSLLGQIVAKALQDGRVLDLPFSCAFYKLVLGKALTAYDIQSFDPALGKALLEFQDIVERDKYLRSLPEKDLHDTEIRSQSMKIEDLCLDFTLPGYPEYYLVSGLDTKMVNLNNLEEYVTLTVDATTNSGIYRQVESFKKGFDQVLPVSHLKVFTEEELEHLLCGEHVKWNSNELSDHIKFDHGYTISSPPVINLLEIMQEFDHEQQRAFLQFVTGAPRLPIGGLASLNPKLTIVRKHCGQSVDSDLPSVMTCANYLKLPPYSSKEVMKQKLLYAIIEGQGSFHLS